MLTRDFDPNDIWIKCRVCNEARPKKTFPTHQRVCQDCAEKMHWTLKSKKAKKVNALAH